MVSAVHKAFAMRVRAVRTERGWAQRELNRRAGLRAPNTVHHVEAGAGIYLDAAVAIADALGISLDTLAAPLKCRNCLDIPRAGFNCQLCGAAGELTEETR